MKKVKVKTTGEYVNVEPNGQRNILCQIYRAEDGRDIPANCLEFEKEIDWEQRQYEIAKEIYSVRLTRFADKIHSVEDMEHVANGSVMAAEALIEALKGKL